MTLDQLDDALNRFEIEKNYEPADFLRLLNMIQILVHEIQQAKARIAKLENKFPPSGGAANGGFAE